MTLTFSWIFSMNSTSTGLRLKYQNTRLGYLRISSSQQWLVKIPVTMTGYKIQTAMYTIVDYVLSNNAAFFGEVRSKLFIHIVATRSDTIFVVQRRSKTWNQERFLFFLFPKINVKCYYLPGVSTTVNLNFTPCSSMHNVFFSTLAVCGGSGNRRNIIYYLGNMYISICDVHNRTFSTKHTIARFLSVLIQITQE